MAFACCKLPNFEIAQPSPQLLATVPGDDSAGDTSKSMNPGDYRLPHVYSIGLPFDELGIGQRVLNDSVHGMLDVAFICHVLTIVIYRSTSHMTPQ